MVQFAEQSLYHFEILLEDFKFSDSKNAPKNENIQARITCGNLINFMIEASHHGKLKAIGSVFGLGKSILFPTTAENLQKMMETQDLVITINDHMSLETVGLINVKWNKDFINAVKEHGNSGKMKPVLYQTQHNIVNTSLKVLGKLNVFLRLNTFGHNIEIDFQNMGSTVNVERIKARLKGTEREKSADTIDEVTNWKPLFMSPFRERRSYMDPDMRLFAEMQGIATTPSISEKLTAQYINGQLCGNKFCPGAQKFKDYGIGPLASKGGGLGTIGTSTKKINTCGLYGISQAYGNLNNYGAYGIFVKNTNKPKCGGSTCPYTNIPVDYKAEQNKQYSNDYNVNQTNDKNCGGPTCPYLRPQNVNNCGGQSCPYAEPELRYSLNKTNPQNYGATVCPYSQQQNYENNINLNQPASQTYSCSPRPISYNHNQENTTCGGPKCPYSVPRNTTNTDNYEDYTPMTNSVKQTNVHCGGATYPHSVPEYTTNSNSCGGQTCPFSEPQVNVNCGGTTCPYSILEDTTNANNCGGETCPFSVPKTNRSFNETNGTDCEGKTCPLSESEQYESANVINSNFCENQSCPYFSMLQNTEKLNCNSTTCTYTFTQNQIVTQGVITDNYDNQNDIYPNEEMISDLKEMKRKVDKNVVEPKKNSPQYFANKVWEKKTTMGTAGSSKSGNTTKSNSRFVYRGERYPGTRIGHRTCNVPGKNVPANMGWLWTVEPEGVVKRRKTWRPGYVSKIINDRIMARRHELGIPEPPALTMLVAKKRIKYLKPQASEDQFFEDLQPKPTLLVQKKGGRYLITMNPLKDPRTLAENENPYMECSPMQFVLVKKKKVRKQVVPANSEVGEGEQEYGEYEEYEYEEEFEGSKEGTESNIENEYTECFCDEDLSLLEDTCSSSSSNSELNIEFTTPAGLIIPGSMKKPPNVVHTETQFHVDDWNCADCPVIIPKKFKHKKKVRLRFR